MARVRFPAKSQVNSATFWGGPHRELGSYDPRSINVANTPGSHVRNTLIVVFKGEYQEKWEIDLHNRKRESGGG